MTNNEAIIWLRGIKDQFTGNCTTDTLVPISRCDIQAIELAIKALEQSEERPQGGCMTIICTEEQKKAIINARFCPFVKDCPFYSTEHGAKYLSCKQCREDNIEWKKEN